MQNCLDDVTHLFIVTPKQKTQEVVNAAVEKGMKMIWIQQKSETPEAVKTVEDAGIPLIYKKCIMMFADPVKSVHGFHRFLVKAFREISKNGSTFGELTVSKIVDIIINCPGL